MDCCGDDDDEFFGDQEDDRRSEKESAAEAERLKVAGYHDTFEDSHNSALQDGFNAGYTDSFDTAVSIGRLLGRLVAHNKLSDHPKGLDPSYLRMASLIRSRLSQLTEETTASSDISRHTLKCLQDEVLKIAAGDSTGEKSSGGNDQEDRSTEGC